jgi:aurora kinase, other
MNVQALLDHHNVLKVYGGFEDSTFIYIVQQLARKGDVYKTYLQQLARLSERDIVVRIIAPLLRALDHAHNRGVIHRDIKPENVFLSESEEVLLGDWGLGIDNVQERPVSCVGTLDYMAPEVLRAPSIPPGKNFRAYSKEPGSYDDTVCPPGSNAN